MDAETKSQVNDLTELRDTHRKRLHVLQRQKAELGRSTPPEIETEIERIEAQIREIDKTITKLYLAEARWMARVRPPLAGDEFTTGDDQADQILAVSRHITNLEDSIRAEVGGLYRLLQINDDRDQAERRRRQLRTDLFYAIIVVILVLVLVSLLR